MPFLQSLPQGVQVYPKACPGEGAAVCLCLRFMSGAEVYISLTDKKRSCGRKLEAPYQRSQCDALHSSVQWSAGCSMLCQSEGRGCHVREVLSVWTVPPSLCCSAPRTGAPQPSVQAGSTAAPPPRSGINFHNPSWHRVLNALHILSTTSGRKLENIFSSGHPVHSKEQL